MARRLVAGRVDEEMRVAGRIRQIIGAAILVHPRSLKITPLRVVARQRGAALIHDQRVLRRRGELEHIGGETRDFGGERGGMVERHLRARHKRAGDPALELAAPDTAEIKIIFAVVIAKHARIDAETALDRSRLRFEWTFGARCPRYPDPENPVLVAGGKIEMVAVRPTSGIGCPKLLCGPGNVP
jgi:hypothetical protein